MGIKSKKHRNLLGSFDVSDLKPDEKVIPVVEPQHNNPEEQQAQVAYMSQQPTTVQSEQPVMAQPQTRLEQGVVGQTQQQEQTIQAGQPLVQIPYSHIVQQQASIKPIKPVGVPGRKRRQLIPGEPEKMISMELPEILVAKVQEYGRQHGLTMKEVIGYILLEKFK